MKHYNIRISDNILLRQPTLNDSDEFFKVIDKNRTHLKTWMNWLDGTKTSEDTSTFISSYLETLEKGSTLSFLIIYKKQIIGITGFNEINKINRYGVIGYWLDQNFAGKGIMTNSLKKIITVGFNELNLNSIQIAAASENKRSRAVPERLGFKLDGIIRAREWLYDHFVDHAVYTLLKSEWPQ